MNPIRDRRSDTKVKRDNGLGASSIPLMVRSYVSVEEVMFRTHVQVKYVPVPIETSGEPRQLQREIRYRADCNNAETAAYIIQGCFRTHVDVSSDMMLQFKFFSRA